MSIARISNTCATRATAGPGLSCDKKATDQWIAVQSNRLPDCLWYSLVFTLPDTLWPLFFLVCGVLRQSGSRSQPWGFGPVIRVYPNDYKALSGSYRPILLKKSRSDARL
ncbi:hypothetical protein GCM10009425_45600 [Pseudomonas asuensis]|uniref:Uncharacterized protein n=1 Tax=Pseudomonas asuensis TaxID=1825787 RepID=A0ABQ2H3V7_9PSED|nr:hypothetical protein GCM10009425_45600 [Pseudomonas asuensis]